METDDEDVSSTDEEMDIGTQSESNDDLTFEPDDMVDGDDPYPGLEKKEEIVAYWMLDRKRRRKWSTMTNKYSKLAKLADGPRTMRKWRKRNEEKGKHDSNLTFRNDSFSRVHQFTL